LALGGGVALTRKKLPPGTKLFIAIVTALSLLVIFNFIF